MYKTLILLLVLSVAMMIASCCEMKTYEPPVEPPVVEPPPPPPEPEPPPPPPPPEPEEIYLEPVYFDFNKYTLTPEARNALRANAHMLLKHPDATIRIEGHCDERGTNEYNMKLGENRAEAAMKFLEEQGVDRMRMSYVSFGEERPAVRESNEAAWAKNRRVEFVLVKQ
jgi:peptidoglycan-associated lipoprotein